MQVEKIYKSLTTKELGVYRGTTVDEVDGKIRHTLLVDGEERIVADSTFRRWWKWVEETTPEDLQESMDLIKEAVLTKEPTIEDLKQLNESGEELTEEELQLFQEQAQQRKEEQDVVVHELPTVEFTTPVEEPQEKKVVVRKSDKPKTAEYFLSRVTELGGEYQIYTEGREGVVKSGGRAVLFFGFVRSGIRVYMKEQLDEAVIKCPYPVEEKHSYPKQYPYRFVIPEINPESEELIEEILKLHI